MTTIAKRKTRLRFETSATVRGRPIVVEVDAFVVYLRLKHQRIGFPISWEGIYMAAAKVAAAKLITDRHAARKGAHA